jgi:hypothetical protein
VAAFFNGSAHAALPVVINGRPGAGWFNRGHAKVAFDFTVLNGVVHSIMFRAAVLRRQERLRRPPAELIATGSPQELPTGHPP